VTRADLEKRPGEVSAMFDALAGRYDLMNDLLSAGQVRLWRRAVTRILGARPGDKVLDLAAGTGTSTAAFAKNGADAVAVDFSLGMLQAGRYRPSVAGDALKLPFRDSQFDATTISFGLRNVSDTQAALEEMRRVTKKDGKLVVCEFSSITVKPLDQAYRRYLLGVVPKLALRFARNPEAYVYLAESIQAWPSQPELAEIIRNAGWRNVKWRDLSTGIVAVHVARS
jgi:demethylmenaquinone methyltransferase / 2-methoxy-6-polyprenyl-1,4-benzoquinol methylase